MFVSLSRNRTGALSPNNRNGALRQFVSKACSATPELAFLADMFLTSVLQQPEEARWSRRAAAYSSSTNTFRFTKWTSRQARQTIASYVTLPFAGTSLANQPIDQSGPATLGPVVSDHRRASALIIR